MSSPAAREPRWCPCSTARSCAPVRGWTVALGGPAQRHSGSPLPRSSRRPGRHQHRGHRERDVAERVGGLCRTVRGDVRAGRRAARRSRARACSDTGPGNSFIDFVCAKLAGVAFDAGGAFALSGQVRPRKPVRLAVRPSSLHHQVDEALVRAALRHPYFARAAPKSTGREVRCRVMLPSSPARTAVMAAAAHPRSSPWSCMPSGWPQREAACPSRTPPRRRPRSPPARSRRRLVAS